ncbi:hypothetical protein MCAMS1_01461 [biofilm metagenome]
MTGMLASVNSLEEARLVLAAQVDIIDLKEPGAGSLGALPTALITEIVADIDKRVLTSCTIGDLPMDAKQVYSATSAVAQTGVDYVKVGIFPGDGTDAVLEKLADLAQRFRLIAVLFADAQPDFGIIDWLHRIGFSGIMLDTLDKSNGALTEIMRLKELECFVINVKSRQLICGLAGSLRLDDVPQLLRLQPDYLGFRGALCEKNDRSGRINSLSVEQLKRAMVG